MFNRILGLAGILAVLTSGCSMLPRSARRTLATPYQPANVFLRQPTLPESIRRVAVLPIPESRQDEAQACGAKVLQPVLLDEINKRNAFELISLTSAQVREYTGADCWGAEDRLPHDFFEHLSQATGCDGVIFLSLTAYRPYPPLRTGWRARLVDCSRHQTWWAVDEVFDAGADPVAAAAQAYGRASLGLPNPILADTGVLESPSRFGQYTANAVAGTLPRR